MQPATPFVLKMLNEGTGRLFYVKEHERFDLVIDAESGDCVSVHPQHDPLHCVRIFKEGLNG